MSRPADASAREIPELPRPAVYAGIVIGVLAVSTAATLIRLADAHPLALAFWRCALGSAALAPFALRARRGAPRVDARQRRELAGAGVFLAVHFALFISSLSYTTVAASTVLVAMSPLFVGLGSAVLLAEPPTRRTWTGVVLAGAGAVIVGVADGGGAAPNAPFGNALAFAGAAALAGYLLVGRAARRRLPVTVYAAAAYGIAALALLPACLLAGADLVGYDTGTWLAIAALVAGPQLLGHTVFNTLLSTVSATVIAVAVLAEPVAAAALAALVLGEIPAGAFYGGAALILAGIYLAVTRSRGDTLPPG